MAPGHGIVPTITEAAVSEGNIGLALGNRCISIGHKTQVTNATLLALSEAGVTYISTRSVGYNHIDVNYAESVGISVETVAYSPDHRGDRNGTHRRCGHGQVARLRLPDAGP
jgi:D-specific alpha-keto acid dehydrogenase